MTKLFKEKYKKIFIIAVLVFSISIISTGCSSKKEVKEISVNKIVEEIKNESDISSLKERNNEKLEKLYDINSDEIEEFALYTASSNLKADELLILKVKDEKDLPNIEDKINKRIENQSDSFKDYLPDEYYLMEKHVLKTNNNYILFAVSKDVDKIENAFDSTLK